MKFRLLAAGAAAFALPLLGLTPIAHATEPTFEGWVTWRIPAGGTGSDVKYPQPFVGLGEIGSSECGVTYQTDYYEGPKDAVEHLWADKLLTHGEDFPFVKKWYFTTGDCRVTRTFQVDTYLNPTARLAKKAAGYDNDGRLKWGEDKAHYGHSRYQTVKVSGLGTWTDEQWRAGINKATTKKGVGNVTSASRAATVGKGHKLTVAWQTHGSWKHHPQTFFARG